jgi:CheY-like chemotaxis protein
MNVVLSSLTASSCNQRGVTPELLRASPGFPSLRQPSQRLVALVQPVRTGRPIVLLVEDDGDLGLLIKQMLEGLLPVEVVHVTRAEDALDVLRSDPVAVVLSDYHLPGANGTVVLREAARAAPGALRIAMTGHPDPYVSERGQDDGFLVLAKPLDPRLLVCLVEGRLAFWQGGRHE